MKGFLEMLKDRQRQNFTDASPDEFDDFQEPASAEMPDAAHGFSIALKRKRRSTMLKKMLSDAGYGDLSKMINIKEN